MIQGVLHTEVDIFLRRHSKWTFDLIFRQREIKFVQIDFILQSDTLKLTVKYVLPICTNFKFLGVQMTANPHFECCIGKNSNSVFGKLDGSGIFGSKNSLDFMGTHTLLRKTYRLFLLGIDAGFLCEMAGLGLTIEFLASV